MEIFRRTELRRTLSHNNERQENGEESGFDSFSIEMSKFHSSSDLKTAQADFEKFIHVVSEDLATKIKQLKSIKAMKMPNGMREAMPVSK